MRASIPLFLLSLSLAAPAAFAADAEEEVRTAVEAAYAAIRSGLIDTRDAMAAEGALQFWSSGGLMLEIEKGDPPPVYEAFDVYPKHISVVMLSDTSAAALYYAEGSMTPKGSAPVPHYLTRVLEVYVKEKGGWKQRAGHWSPLRGGAGTSRSAE